MTDAVVGPKIVEITFFVESVCFYTYFSTWHCSSGRTVLEFPLEFPGAVETPFYLETEITRGAIVPSVAFAGH